MAVRLGVVAGLDLVPLADAELRELLAAREAFARQRIGWYARRRRLAQAASHLLRGVGCAFIAVGAVTPALREAIPAVAATTLGSFAFGYVLLGLGAAAVAVDQVFGVGRSVPRLAAAEFGVAGELELFRADWISAGEAPAAEARRRRIDLARGFTAEINRLVRRESDRAQDMAI
ncbi:SLATT domain-containing protein [Phenylobacterium aquaticum]|uniref:SLATT domain-containing protein n=1 Tax=Phenylobacterium aquaticum TaxID=1763816 RepID=UPI0026EBCC09|nr:SLATT domain-containing protein [Phenylobacterium aquaticum]